MEDGQSKANKGKCMSKYKLEYQGCFGSVGGAETFGKTNIKRTDKGSQVGKRRVKAVVEGLVADYYWL